MFNEPEWLRLLFLLADTQDWLNQISAQQFHQVPCKGKRHCFRNGYYLSVTAFAHIMERHYHKIPRHPGTGKFTIPVPAILALIAETHQTPAQPVPGHEGWQRMYTTTEEIGYNREGLPVNTITVLTDKMGNIKTAFPGLLRETDGLS
jgi:hypothetical protein